MDAKTLDSIIPHLAAFWRRGRKQYVPLTADEVQRAGVKALTMMNAGLVESVKGPGGHQEYRLTKAGIALHARVAK